MTKRGRPAGSPNRTFVETVERPAACTACGSVNLTALGGRPVNRVEQGGEIDGRTYAAIEWHDKRCECGQAVRVRVYMPG